MAKEHLADQNGLRAHSLLTTLVKELRAAYASYRVMKGDTLGSISARPEVYGSARQWPMIYQANKGSISNPDKIMPGQVLMIPKGR